MIRKIVYFFLFVSYLNILTLIPGIRTAQLHALTANPLCPVADGDYFDDDDYESLCEIFLTDVLEQKDTDYDTDDYPVSSHCVATALSFPVMAATLVKPYIFGSNSNPPVSARTHSYAVVNNSDIHAHYYNYLFRLTPF